MKTLIRFGFVAMMVLAMGCQGNTNSTATPASDDSTNLATGSGKDSTATTPPVSADSISMVSLTKEILKLAAVKDYKGLGQYIHPDKGIRFSPYTYVDVEAHLLLSATDFQQQAAAPTKKKLLWGTSDPMGEPINLTLDAYFKSFGYDHDYLKEGRFAFNQTIGGGTTINNIVEVYPQAVFVEAYWVPEDEEKAPYEWGSIRLIFERSNDKYFLVGWVHDAWST